MRLNVIVIDDSVLQLTLSSQLIKKNPNLNLLGAYSDPYLGLKAVNQHDVDVVILDVEMPEIDGFSLQKLFKDSVEVVMNSTRGCFELQAYVNGAIDFLLKPLSASKITRAVRRVDEIKEIMATENAVMASVSI